MGKVKVLIVEDEIIIADNIADTLEDLGYEVLEPATTFSAAMETIAAERPDIAILDIQLSGQKSGIDLAVEINEHQKFPFIFLSSNTDKLTLEEAKRVEPLAYLVKPFSKEELYTSIEVALYNFSKRQAQALDQSSLVIKDALFIKSNKVFLRLNFSDILFLRSDHVYIDILMTDGQRHTVRGSLNEYINKLSNSFFRSHRSCIINLDHLHSIDHSGVLIKDQVLPIGKKQREEILGRLNRG